MEVDVRRLKEPVRLLGKGGCINEDALLRVMGAAVREEVDEVEGTSTIVSSSDIGMSPWLVFPRR